MNDNESKTVSLIDGCLTRLAAGDKSAWDELLAHAFNRLLAQCERVIRKTISCPNPMVTANSVLAELYLRLRTAMENANVKPTTAVEFFGLTARNIRWQIGDMLRRPSIPQSDPAVFDRLAEGTGVATNVETLEQWRLFWEAVATLDSEEQQVFDLLWINQLSQYEAAEALGINRNRVDTLWRRVKLKIGKACKDALPPE